MKNLKDKIYFVRNKQVMLDSDLAQIYEVTNGTKDINKAVKRIWIDFQRIFIFS